MINKKIASEVAVGVILLLAVIVGSIFWLKNQEKIPEMQQATVQPIVPVEKKQQAQIKEDSIVYQGKKITVNLPQNWGELVVPKVNEVGHVISDNSYRDKNDDNSILIGAINIGTEFSKMISNYSYGERADYLEVPTITLATYPATFENDESGDFGSLTKNQKDANFKPLFDVFAQKNVNNIELNQNCFLNQDSSAKCVESNPSGYWWENMGQISDRVAARYFENSTSDLRGIGFFSINGQDTPDTITAYKIVLINPEKRILVYIYLPLNGIYSFPKSTDEALSVADLKRAYAYLENQDNYKNTPLEEFMNEVRDLIFSIEIAS